MHLSGIGELVCTMMEVGGSGGFTLGWLCFLLWLHFFPSSILASDYRCVLEDHSYGMGSRGLVCAT